MIHLAYKLYQYNKDTETAAVSVFSTTYSTCTVTETRTHMDTKTHTDTETPSPLYGYRGGLGIGTTDI